MSSGAVPSNFAAMVAGWLQKNGGVSFVNCEKYTPFIKHLFLLTRCATQKVFVSALGHVLRDCGAFFLSQ
jgi:hypothetical protein